MSSLLSLYQTTIVRSCTIIAIIHCHTRQKYTMRSMFQLKAVTLRCSPLKILRTQNKLLLRFSLRLLQVTPTQSCFKLFRRCINVHISGIDLNCVWFLPPFTSSPIDPFVLIQTAKYPSLAQIYGSNGFGETLNVIDCQFDNKRSCSPSRDLISTEFGSSYKSEPITTTSPPLKKDTIKHLNQMK